MLQTEKDNRSNPLARILRVKINPVTTADADTDFPHVLKQLLILWHTSLQSMHVFIIVVFNQLHSPA